MNSLEKYKRSEKEVNQFYADHSEGVDLNMILKFHGFTDTIASREISKLDIVAIYSHQELTYDGFFFFFF
jgi:hypothetical protein